MLQLGLCGLLALLLHEAPRTPEAERPAEAGLETPAAPTVEPLAPPRSPEKPEQRKGSQDAPQGKPGGDARVAPAPAQPVEGAPAPTEAEGPVTCTIRIVEADPQIDREMVGVVRMPGDPEMARTAPCRR